MSKTFLKIWIGLIAATLPLLGCAKPNMQILSNWYKKADSSQKGKVVLTAGYLTIVHEPSARELAAFPKVKSKMKDLGFQVVDSISEADMILNVNIYENLPLTYFGHLWSTAQWTSPQYVTSSGSYWRRGMNGGGEIVNDSNGYDVLAMRLSTLKQTDKPPTEVWHAAVRTRSEYLENDLDKIVDLAIAQYGKNTTEYLVYKPANQNEKVAAR